MNKEFSKEGILSKKFLFSLRKGFIVSSIVTDDLKNVFAESVSTMADREKQWLKIKKLSCNHRNCRVFENKKTYLNSNWSPEAINKQIIKKVNG